MNDAKSNQGRGFRRRRRGRGRGNGGGGGGNNGQNGSSAADTDTDDRVDTAADDGYEGDGEDEGEDRGDDSADSGPAAAEPVLKVPDDKTVIIGITGEPGSGKTALAREFVRLGATLIDADAAGHDLIETTLIKKKLVKAFGEDIIGEDGAIARRKLAAKAFADADSTKTLNEIVHPKLITTLKGVIKKAGNFLVIDCALLHELELASTCTQTVYVRAPRDSRTQRVADRGWDEGELARRESALGEAEARRRQCGLTVDNKGDATLLTAYAKHILARQLGVDPALLRRPEPAPRPQGHSAPPADHQGQGQGGQQPGQHRPQHQPNQQQQPERPPERPPVKVELDQYLRQTLPQLQAEADKLGVQDVKWLKKHDLICEILRRVAGGRLDEILIQGHVETVKEQHAYVRSAINGYLAVSTDAFIANPQIRRFGIKAGMLVTGTARAPRGQERCPQVLSIQTVMGEPENQRTAVQDFEHLTPLHAFERLFMELPNDPTDYSLRIIDLVSPIGKGQRGLIVAQPKCGKTVYLQKIAKAITTNNPEVTLIVLLVDERPEEVTDMQRNVHGEVVASTFDQPAQRHVACAEMVINKAKRLVEHGKDVVILLDSITRLARAYNTEAPSSGRIMSGGIEAGALIKPKQFFGAARKIEHGGSLTILATALVDTGSLMDTVIFEEFKGTGNMELVLDRRMANRRIFPAVDCAASGTRKDELLIGSDDELRRVWALRKFLAERSQADAIDFLKGKLKNYKTNVEFLLSIDPDKLSSW